MAEALAAAHNAADVAIVSSANREAVEEEWTRCGLLPSVDVLCCQDSGSKAACIAQLKDKGYDPAHILMVGDAPGDQAAAAKNGVLFYPSWPATRRKAGPNSPPKPCPPCWTAAMAPTARKWPSVLRRTFCNLPPSPP